MTMITELLSDIRDFCRQANIAESTFGRMSVNDGRLVERVETGRVTIRTVERVRQYMAKNSNKQPRAKTRRREKCHA